MMIVGYEDYDCAFSKWGLGTLEDTSMWDESPAAMLLKR